MRIDRKISTWSGSLEIGVIICDPEIVDFPSSATGATRFFFYKHKVHKHTQPQIREILSTLLSTPPASDFEIDNKISEKM